MPNVFSDSINEAYVERRLSTLEKKVASLEENQAKLQNQMKAVFMHLSELNKAKNIEETVEVLSSLGKQSLEVENCKFWFYEQSRNKAFTISDEGEKVYTDLTQDTAISRAILSNEAIMFDKIEDFEVNNLPVVDKTYISEKNAAIIPLQSELGSVMGVVVAQNKADGFSENDIRMFSADGEIGSAFKLGLSKEMQHQVGITDRLTHLQNRFGLEEYNISDTLNRLNNNAPVSVSMCDIDHFKAVNDTYGHDAGDKVLQQVAEILKEQIGSSGEVFRQGGEEFVVVYNNPPELAYLDADKIREAIQNTPCDIGNGNSINITISIGLQQLKATENISKENVVSAVSTSLSMADQLLYVAKESGRNQVVDFDKLLKIKGLEKVQDDPFAKDGLIVLKNFKTGKECGFDGIDVAITCLKDENAFQECFPEIEYPTRQMEQEDFEQFYENVSHDSEIQTEPTVTVKSSSVQLRDFFESGKTYSAMEFNVALKQCNEKWYADENNEGKSADVRMTINYANESYDRTLQIEYGHETLGDFLEYDDKVGIFENLTNAVKSAEKSSSVQEVRENKHPPEENKANEKQIVGNTPYYQLGTKEDLQYFGNLNNRHAANVMRELDKDGVKYSGVIIGDKATLTLNKADAPKYYAAVDTVKQLYSKASLGKWQDNAEQTIAQVEKSKEQKETGRGER